MKVLIYLKGKKDPIIYEGDRVDVVDLNLNGVDYKQVRYFRKGISRSELIVSDLISKIKNN